MEGKLGTEVPASRRLCPINSDYAGTVRHALPPVVQLHRLSGTEHKFHEHLHAKVVLETFQQHKQDCVTYLSLIGCALVNWDTFVFEFWTVQNW